MCSIADSAKLQSYKEKALDIIVIRLKKKEKRKDSRIFLHSDGV